MDADFIPVTVEQYLQNPVSAPVRFLHLGKIKGKSATVVVLNQLQDSAVVKAFAKSQSDVVYYSSYWWQSRGSRSAECISRLVRIGDGIRDSLA